eukprot:Lithocolla_globosa_v1_NODE_479_length_3945_cov_27.737018.p1 type:complete len:374 gc:universal NODE_479_length_3945_cov_27.737018:834-1955(+)
MNVTTYGLNYKLKKNKKHLVSIIYHSPNKQDTSVFTSSLDETLTTIKQQYDITIMGDMNIDLLKTNSTSDYLQNMTINGLKSLIVYPTHITETSESLIDHIFTNNSSKQVTAGIIYGDVADHLPTFCVFNDIHAYFKESTTTNYYEKKNYDKSKFRSDLNESKLSSILKEKNPEAVFTEFMNIFSPISQSHIPLKTVSKKNSPSHKARKQWITSSLKKQIRKQHRLYEQTQKQPNNAEIKTEHRKFRNRLRKDLQKSKKIYYEKFFTKHLENSRKTWSVIKNILRKSRSQSFPKQINIQLEDGTINTITEKKEIANSFNKFFTTVVTNQRWGKYLIQRICKTQQQLMFFILKHKRKRSQEFVITTRCNESNWI